ncbi:MAG: anaerobic ribonucleoside-triphosphate reductase activating protein [Bacteroidia bacterium]|nr:anaerobic ribonucleoside-triphosphate reductase activating protein [Bacteroidia bacterium]
MNTNNEYNLAKADVVKPIYSITPFTLLDYPDKTACILWFAGCNMRCQYCYNPDIVLGKGKLSYQEILKFLKTRVNLLDGVVLSGGECTLHKNIIKLIVEIKKMGLLIKVDTNGTKPKIIEFLLKEKLIDYVALDFKAPIDKFKSITKSNLYSNFITSLKLLINSAIPFEVRTTLHSSLLVQNDIQRMIDVLEKFNYEGIYYIQNFINDTKTIAEIENSRQNSINTTFFNTKLSVLIRN